MNFKLLQTNCICKQQIEHCPQDVLTLSQTTIFRLFQTEEFADDNLKLNLNAECFPIG